MMRHSFLSLAVLSVMAAPASADSARADFIEGVFAKPGLCEKVAAVDAGGPKNVDTVTETFSADGFRSWEGSCDFVSITEKEKGRSYEAQMKCIEGPEEWTETNVFELDPSGNAMTIFIDGDKHEYVKCGSEKGK